MQNSMQRAFLPNVLASLGLILILLATVLPLFEWEIEMNADFSSSYKVHSEPSPWTTKLGESLDDSSYIFKRVQVLVGEAICTNDEEFIGILRSQKEKSLESISVKIDKYTASLIGWSFITVILSGVFIWWFIVWQDHRPISSAIAPMLLSVVFICLLIGVLRLVDPRVSGPHYLMISDQCQGSLILDVKLSKLHFEMPMIMFLGILGELSALGIMLRQFIRAIMQGRESSKSAVG
jgi:hypothetical protein